MPPFAPRKLFTHGLPLAGAAATAAGVYMGLRTDERPSWPPPPDAVTGDSAMAAVAAFAAGAPLPTDVGLSYGRSTAATVDPRAGGDQFYPRLFADIGAATSSIHILMFGWKPGIPGGELTDAIVDKLAAGVEVRILVDAYGSRPYGLSEAMYQRLADAGAEIVVNNFLPPRQLGLYPDASARWKATLPFRADHRKLYVIDGVAAWTGGAGVEDHFADGRFHDVMVRVTGDVVRLAQAVSLTSFCSHGALLPADLTPYFPPPPDHGTVPAALVQVVPYGHVSATHAARELIDGAAERLDIMYPYLTDADMVGRIIAAGHRGATVRLVVSRESNNGFATAALRHRYLDLITAGVEVWEYPGAVVHAKVIVADDLVQFGTLNLDAWALYRNFEVAMIVDSAAIAARFEERVFGPAIERSSIGTPPTAVGARAFGALAHRLTYFL